jgi:small-conductance mechanosensitive channel
MLLSPFLPQYRIPAFGDREAKRLFYWASVMATYSAFSILFSVWIKDFGLNYNVFALLYGFLSLIAILGNVAMLIVNGRAISGAIRGGRERRQVSWPVRALSILWAPFLIGYFIFSWLELSFDLVMENDTSIPPVAGVYTTFLSIIVVYGFINYLIETYFSGTHDLRRINADLARSEAEEAAAEASEAAQGGEVMEPDAPAEPMEDRPYSIMTYQELAQRSAAILAFMAGTYALIRIWDTERTIQSSQSFDRLLDLFVILFIGYIVYHLFRIWIDLKISEETSDAVDAEMGDEGGHSGATRLATLLPLFRGAMLAVVLVTITLIALMEVGINVSPLFAGAGVVGLAVGFGAQTLVRDIFSGAFFLFDDAFRRGEYIDIGTVKGTVEKISVRSFQLRHHLGALHTIPFGEIQVLTNYSRDWVIMKLPLRVTYDTDVEKVRKLIKALGKELLNDPVIGDNFIQPLKSQGVIEMQDSAMIIRVKFMTKPGDQWLVRKKVYEEIRHLFEKEGIKFAHREVTVRLADEPAEPLTPRQREAITAAAREAIDEDAMDGINEAN